MFELGTMMSMAAYLVPSSSYSGMSEKEAELEPPNFVVDVQYYTTDSLFEIFAAVAKVYFAIVGMVFYGQRIATYNNGTNACVAINGFNTYDPLEINDVFWFFIFLFSVPF